MLEENFLTSTTAKGARGQLVIQERQKARGITSILTPEDRDEEERRNKDVMN